MDGKSIKSVGILATLIILLAVVYKVYLISQGVFPFNSDEAVVGLMARHIRQGTMPVFFYGQAYMGSLDALLVSLGFSLFGEKVVVIRVVQTILYGLFLGTFIFLGKLIFRSWKHGLIAGSLMAIPTVTVTLYSTVSLGGYGEALVIGNLLLILAILISRALVKDLLFWFLVFLWAFLAGFGLWVFGLTLVYSIPAFIYIFWNVYKSNRQKFVSRGIAVLIIMIFGGLLGTFPLWTFAIQEGIGVLIHELTGGAIANVNPASYHVQIWMHFINFILFGSTAIFGIRPPWEIRWLAVPLLPFILAFWLGVIFYSMRISRRYPNQKEELRLLGTVILTLTIVYIFSPFGGDPSGRYFIPISIALTLLAAGMIQDLARKYSKWAYGLIVLLMVYNLWGTLASADRFPPGLTTQFDPVAQVDHSYMDELISFLETHNETRGYTNYWVSYPLAFLSDEELIFIPHLPHHEDFRYTSRDDRYPPYRDWVEDSNRVAYITTNHPALNKELRELFLQHGIDWKEVPIGDFQVFYELTEKISPSELGINED